jgi:hypothetical protein
MIHIKKEARTKLKGAYTNIEIITKCLECLQPTLWYINLSTKTVRLRYIMSLN